MRQRLLSRAQALQLPAERLTELLQRLHFASQPPAAVDGWLPQLLAQWQMPRRIVRAKAQPQAQPQREGNGSSTRSSSSSSSSELQAAVVTSAQGGTAAAPEQPEGPAAAAQQGVGQPSFRSIASGRLDAFYGWLPWPLTGLQGDLAFAGWDCEWIRAGRQLHSRLNGSVALVALSAFPGDSSEAAEGQLADVELASRHSSGSSSGGSSGSSGSTGSTAKNRWQPRSRCSYARIVQAAEAAGATAVLLAAPAGRYPHEANCSCPEECGAELSIPATMVPHSVGVVLRDVLRAGDRVNVSFEEEQVRGRQNWSALGMQTDWFAWRVWQGFELHTARLAACLTCRLPKPPPCSWAGLWLSSLAPSHWPLQGPGLWAGIDAPGALFELGWPKVASLLHGVWAAQYQAYLQGLQERLAGESLDAACCDFPVPATLYPSRQAPAAWRA